MQSRKRQGALELRGFNSSLDRSSLAVRLCTHGIALVGVWDLLPGVRPAGGV
jgi:hypothetical protein